MQKRSAMALSTFLTAAALSWTNPGGLAAQPAPLGPETRVDVPAATTESSEFPTCPALAVRQDGAFQIAWDYGGNFPSYVAGRNYGSDGLPTGTQLHLANRGYYPEVDDIRPVSGGGYEVLFHVVNDLRPERPNFFLQRLDALGRPVGKAQSVGTRSYRDLWFGSGPGLFGGRWLAANRGFALQRLNAAGKPSGPDVRVVGPLRNLETQLFPLIGRRMVLVWTGFSEAKGEEVIRARRLDGAGRPLGPEIEVNTIPGSPESAIPFIQTFQVAAAPDGGFAVAWSFHRDEEFRIYVRFFDSEGIPQGSELAAVSIDDPDTVFSGVRSVAFNEAGDLFLLWHRRTLEPQDGELLARIVESDGTLGPEFSIRSNASRRYPDPLCGSVKWADGNWIVTWMAGRNPFFEPSGLFVRRFDGD